MDVESYMEAAKKAHKESYIDASIKTPGGLPKNILWLLELLADYDSRGAWWLYFDRLDDLWVNSKNAIAAGIMSKKDWEILEKKYWIHADLIYDKEEENGKKNDSSYGQTYY